jgi:phospholipid/cholesterol/gamma-HCH transport system substrate-binding protein
MKEEFSKTKLGAFVLAGTIFLLLGLYFIGSKKNIFHSSINVSADFNNVGGLLAGNNVRFNGVNVGTISKVYAISDTAIKVEFTIDKTVSQFISSDDIVSIGTDGLLGSKLINISPGKNHKEQVKENDVLQVSNPLQMDNALRTLVKTNDNLEVISSNLKSVSEKFQNSNSLWRLLTDSTIAENVNSAIVKFKLTGENTAVASGDLSILIKSIRSGKGSIGALVTDTSFSSNLNQTIVKIKTISDTFALLSGDFKTISRKLNNKEGSIGHLINDTAFVHELNQSMGSIKLAAGSFDENMKALHSSWPFKRYFKKQAKKKN